MRHLRAKQGRKTLNYYRISFGIAPPYSVLLDGNFIHLAMTQKVDLHSRIRKHLGGEKFNLFVPECVVAELRSIGAPVELALDFALAHCEIVATAQGARPNDAVKGLVGRTNPRRFFVATQEEDLRNFLRTLPGVPLLHLQRTVLLLETPSSSSRKASGREEADKLIGGGQQDAVIQEAIALRDQERAEKRRRDGAASAKLGPKKEKAKGPNPLSVMKKKAKPSSSSGEGTRESSNSTDAKPKKVRRKSKTPRSSAAAAASGE